MKRFLPIVILLILFLMPLVSLVTTSSVYGSDADTPDPNPGQGAEPTSPPPPTPIGQNDNPPLEGDDFTSAPEGAIPTGTWVEDGTVTFSGKNAARAGLLLNWTLRDYAWYTPLPGQTTNPLVPFWGQIRNIVYAVLILVVLATAFILIVTRGKSIRAKIFIPRFIAVVLLITFSFSLLQFIYQMADIVMGFFLRVGDNIIQNQDLLYVGWDYRDYYGLRMYGQRFEESAFISLLFVRLTALTYYFMVGILIIRKIILWFFIIVSPIFPLLLLYYPVRNTGKIWIGEFFRWLLYGPLFAVFLGGLVSLWRQGIPMNFNFSQAGNFNDIIFPTAVNITLAGPQQAATMTNNLNLPDTFALYLVALLMLWATIIVPWILLRIFLEYAQSLLSGGGAAYLKNFYNRNPKTPPPGPVPPPAPFGVARDLPIAKKFNIPPTAPHGAGLAREIPRDRDQQVQIPKVQMPPVQVTREILRDIKVNVPTIRDIAKLETNRQEVSRVTQQLQNIANPASISSVTDRQKFTQIREQLIKESKAGNPVATNILNAARNVTMSQATSIANTTQSNVQNVVQTILKQISNPTTVTSVKEREKVKEVKETIVRESQKGNPVATSIMQVMQKPQVTKEEAEKVKKDLKVAAEEKGDPLAIAVLSLLTQPAATPQQVQTALPATNRVQQVSLEDYEAIKSMWTENYQNMDVPQSVHGPIARNEWINDDINQINTTINLLSSPDATKQAEGMKEVSNILPFLMIGGFSQAEITSYLKAKLEAAKTVKSELDRKSAEEDTLLETQKRTTQASKTMAATHSASIPQGGGASGTSDDVDDDSPLAALTKATEQHNILGEAGSKILQMTHIKVPTIHDVAKQEVATLKPQKDQMAESQEVIATLEKIAAPDKIADPAVRQQYTTLRQTLTQESQAGNPMAVAILNAASMLHPTETQPIAVPQENKIQQVSLDDYEAVKRLWMENYRTLETPVDGAGNPMDRLVWITKDKEETNATIALLTSGDQQKVAEGLRKVGHVLPFLLIGGFSQSEMISYLKAKFEAARIVKEELETKNQEQESLVEQKAAGTTEKSMNASQVTPDEEEKNNGNGGGIQGA